MENIIENKLENIIENKKSFTESVDANFIISFGMKDIKGNKKKSKVYNLIDFPCKTKVNNRLIILTDEIEVKEKFDDITFTPYENFKLNKKSLKGIDAIFSIGSSMSRFAPQHKLIGTKKLSPKESEGTLFKKKEDLISTTKSFLLGRKQRICFNLLQKMCILNCSVGNTKMEKSEIIENFNYLEKYLLSENFKEFFGLQKNIKITSKNITSTMHMSKKMEIKNE